MNAVKRLVVTNSVHLDQAILSEAVLIDAAKAGEGWAFSELCLRHSAKVYRIIFSITKNHEDAEDALQTALMSAFKNFQQFDSRARFSTWLTSIAINSALMLLRARRRCHEISICGDENEEGSRIEWDLEDTNALDPEKACLDREMSRCLTLAAERLPAGYRSLTLLQLSGDRSVQELADLIGITTAAAKSRMARAKRLLRAAMPKARHRGSSQHPVPSPANA